MGRLLEQQFHKWIGLDREGKGKGGVEGANSQARDAADSLECIPRPQRKSLWRSLSNQLASNCLMTYRSWQLRRAYPYQFTHWFQCSMHDVFIRQNLLLLSEL